LIETQEKRDSSARSVPRNDKILIFPQPIQAAGVSPRKDQNPQVALHQAQGEKPTLRNPLPKRR
jgi:hypothetical protein